MLKLVTFTIDNHLIICYNRIIILKGYIMKEKLKDLGMGLAVILGIAFSVYAAISLGELVNMTSDQIRLGLATPFFIYFCYLFGGLTRSMLNRSN
jgi:hypothetical protein